MQEKGGGGGDDDEFWMLFLFFSLLLSLSYGLIHLTGHQFPLIDLLKYYYKQTFLFHLHTEEKNKIHNEV